MITVSGLDDNKQYIPIKELKPGQFFTLKQTPDKLYQFIGIGKPDNCHRDSYLTMHCKRYPTYHDTWLSSGFEVFPVDVEIKVSI